MSAELSSVFELLSLGKDTASTELAAQVVSHVRSEPKLLAKLMPSLAEQVHQIRMYNLNVPDHIISL